MVHQVAFAASVEEARPVLTGVLLKLDGDHITMAATDGFRISIREDDIPNPVSHPIEAIIPARALIELSRIVSSASEDTLIMTFPAERGQVIFHMQNLELVSQLIEGSFPIIEPLSRPVSKPIPCFQPAGCLKPANRLKSSPEKARMWPA